MLFFFAFPRFVTVSTAFVLAEVGSRRSPASKKNAPRPRSVPKHSKIKYNLFHRLSVRGRPGTFQLPPPRNPGAHDQPEARRLAPLSSASVYVMIFRNPISLAIRAQQP